MNLLPNKRQKISPARPLGTGKEGMLMTKPGVRGRKTPVENRTIDYCCLFFRLTARLESSPKIEK